MKNNKEEATYSRLSGASCPIGSRSRGWLYRGLVVRFEINGKLAGGNETSLESNSKRLL